MLAKIKKAVEVGVEKGRMTVLVVKRAIDKEVEVEE